MSRVQDDTDLASVRSRFPEYGHAWRDKELHVKFHSYVEGSGITR